MADPLTSLAGAQPITELAQSAPANLSAMSGPMPPKKGGRGPGEIGSMLGIFAGWYAAQNLAKEGIPEPLQALQMAQDMQDKGASIQDIYDKTSKLLKTTPFAGITKTKDGQFRFEIPDNEMKIKKTGSADRMEDAVSHPLFFAAYPKMKDRHIAIGGGDLPKGADAAYSADDGRVVMSHDDVGVLAHELNHAAQHFEGDLFAGTIGPGQEAPTKGEAARNYFQQPSEAEAEETNMRHNWTTEFRQKNPPHYSLPGSTDNHLPPYLPQSANDLVAPGPRRDHEPWMGPEVQQPAPQPVHLGPASPTPRNMRGVDEVEYDYVSELAPYATKGTKLPKNNPTVNEIDRIYGKGTAQTLISAIQNMDTASIKKITDNFVVGDDIIKYITDAHNKMKSK